MSIHQSLKLNSKQARSRNVLKRNERLEIMRRRGSWVEARDSVLGLPKLRLPRS
jgi:small basic protein (TIGR04137 family)